ncbi:zinc-binding alcohol dehydrogenase family protein [Pseudovibrio sp. Tun.PSC04-5.I4]|uniref:zinc-binding alcohol dehydrogenase family protein n=1 Tax=Pseudovibrio sp. Tun.PSC04-5.I4 TaxID=1798213 RepID=UPI00088B9468|nr:zinc-binding alcohol dehydrogenase family protein [Pseudovibrio sp. Tun.PSC04-5.I4]SDR48535.1 2-desacetyl-2-hydroxyethyl bacteriochlorophyllide A dehydrogenase [Pseudovibrio sp. Tun.PSC04-5.I4]
MKTLICNGPNDLEYIEQSVPTPNSDEVLLKISAIGICGTDIHAYTGKQPFFSYPRVLGHEICGVVQEVGTDCKDVAVGDRVAVMPVIYCGECPACKAGKTNCCESASLYGVHQDGGFCEFLAVKAINTIKVPAHFSDCATAYVEPFTISAHAVRRGEVAKGSTVLVVGAGPIGIGVAAVAKAKGADVIVADVQESRLEHVRNSLGLKTINPTTGVYAEELAKLCGGQLPSVLFDVTGNKHAMTDAVSLICAGGKIVFVGLYIGDLKIDDPTFHKKETTLLSSRNSSREDYEYVISLLESGDLHEKLLHNRTYDFYTIGNSYEEDVVNNKELIKGLITFN